MDDCGGKQRPHLGVRQVLESLADCITTALAIQHPLVMPDEWRPVSSERDVKLQRRDARLEAGCEGKERALGREATRASVALQIEQRRGCGREEEERTWHRQLVAEKEQSEEEQQRREKVGEPRALAPSVVRLSEPGSMCLAHGALS